MKFRRLIPALCMLLLSAVLASTSTYAWFSMNTQVTAKNMEVKAVAEDGISIAAYDGNNLSDYSDAVDATVAQKQNMRPIFTSDCEVWYHASSRSPSDAVDITPAGYELFTTEAPDSYLYNKFSIKSMGTDHDIWVKEITIISGGTQAYDPAIRIAIKTDLGVFFFAPIGTHTTDETTKTGGDLTTAETISFTTVNTAAAQILTGVDSTGSDVEIWIYYDGEDAECKSDNIVEFNATKIDVVFTSVQPS